MLTTNRQVPKWFHSCRCCAHQVINFCVAPLSSKPPRLLPLSSAILLGNRTTPLAVLHRARPDIIEPACHRPTCHCSIIKRTRLGCRRLISRYVLQQLIVFAVAMVVVVKAELELFFQRAHRYEKSMKHFSHGSISCVNNANTGNPTLIS